MTGKNGGICFHFAARSVFEERNREESSLRINKIASVCHPRKRVGNWNPRVVRIYLLTTRTKEVNTTQQPWKEMSRRKSSVVQLFERVSTILFLSVKVTIFFDLSIYRRGKLRLGNSNLFQILN